MDAFPPRNWTELAAWEGPHCISIYLPTHRKGMEVNEGQDKLVLKNLLREAAQRLKTQGVSEKEIDTLLKPANDLLKGRKIWHFLSASWALFISRNFFASSRLPFEAGTQVFVSRHFYLLPLAPAMEPPFPYFFLYVNLKGCRLFQADRYHWAEEKTETPFPTAVADVAGADVEQVMSQFHSTGKPTAIHHGRGAGKDDVREEVALFLQETDDILNHHLAGHTEPLIVGGVPYLADRYLHVSKYPGLIREVPANVPEFNMEKWHTATWLLMAPKAQERVERWKDQYRQWAGTGRTAAHLPEIMPAAIEGRVEVLWIKKDTEIWGQYNPFTTYLRLDSEQLPDNTSLLNWLGKMIIANGGQLQLIPAYDMPDVVDTPCQALFRY